MIRAFIAAALTFGVLPIAFAALMVYGWTL